MIRNSEPLLVYLYYILGRSSLLGLNINSQRIQDVALLITPSQQFVLAIHLRLSTFFYFNQLSDTFAYDTPAITTNFMNAKSDTNTNTMMTNTVLQIYHLLNLHRKLYVFVNILTESAKTEPAIARKTLLKSTEDFFKNAWWAEREISELFGVGYSGKSDSRNLLLQYGMVDCPMQKFFPAVGTSEVTYYQLIDSVIKIPLALQY